MKSSFFGSRSGIILAAAGMIAGVVTSATSPVQAFSENSTPESSVDLTAQPSQSLIAKDDEDDETDEEIKALPEEISSAIFKDVSAKNRLQASQLRIVKIERQTWADGCLGLTSTDTAAVCTQSLVPGWRVIVASGEQRWVYRTNNAGSLVKLDEVATRTSSSETTAQVTRQEVTTSRTTQTTQTTTGSNQGSAATTSVSGSQSRTSQGSQVVTGATSISGSQSLTSQGSQASGGGTMGSQTSASQSAQGSSITRTQQTQVARRRAEVKFSDVSQSFWAKDYITELAGRGILTGFPDGKFRPDEPVTRAQFAALVAAVFNKTKVRSMTSFRDVSSSYWAYEGIRDAYERGFVEVGSDNAFNPTQSMTRLQVITTLARGLNYSVSSSTEKVLQFYNDSASIPANYRSLVAAATERGVVVNYPNVKNCNPNQVATRAEVAAMLYQAMVSNGDAAALSTSASSYVAGTQTRAVEAGQTEQNNRNKPRRQNCNQGIGNGAEGCDPGNSSPRGGSNDEGGRTPGNRPNK